MGPTFFGLTSADKALVHKSIFTLAYFSEGAFSFDQVYNLPIYLRTFYLKHLEEVKLKEAEMMDPKNSKPSKR